MRSLTAQLLALFAFLLATGLTNGFSSRVSTLATRSPLSKRQPQAQPPSTFVHISITPTAPTLRHHATILWSQPPGDDDDSLADRFDAGGFGNYLAPYAAAVVAALLATAAFLEYVLLDY